MGVSRRSRVPERITRPNERFDTLSSLVGVSITSDIYAHALPGWQKDAADAFAQPMEP